MTYRKAFLFFKGGSYLFPAVAALQILGACATAPNPAEGPSASLAASESFNLRSKAANSLPTVSLTISPSQISGGEKTTFTATLSKTRSSATKVSYSMSGTAVRGTNYTISATQFSIPAGSLSGTLKLTEVSSNGSMTAKMTLASGSAYTLSSSITSTVTLKSGSPTPTPTPTPAPTPTPRPSPAQEVWIQIRPDGLSGSGTEGDPYDGSTVARFDGVMLSFQNQPNILFHLGPGTFRTAAVRNGSPFGPPAAGTANHPWAVFPGWDIEGAGMDATTIQLEGPAPSVVADIKVLTCCWNIPTNNVVIRNLTVDCNWPVLATTALTGASGEENISVSAIAISGSNNLVENVRSKNVYGSAANARECVSIRLFSSEFEQGTNDIIHACRSESPYGNYSSAFYFGGSDNLTYHLTNSKVYECTAVGLNTGTIAGFTIGGVNGGCFQNCEVSNNTFIDCAGAFYSDSGDIDGLKILNNSVTRGWQCIYIVAAGDPSWTKRNITISGNTLSVQNRSGNAPSDVITFRNTSTTGVTIDSNTITFDLSGPGMAQFHTILGQYVSTIAVTNNTISSALPALAVVQFDNCSGVTSSGNRTPQGGPVPGLN